MGYHHWLISQSASGARNNYFAIYWQYRRASGARDNYFAIY
jgi:hypothetical protein